MFASPVPIRLFTTAVVALTVGCAHGRQTEPPDPTDPRVVELKRENHELRRKIAHLEDRLVQLTGSPDSTAEAGLPVVKLRPPRPDPAALPDPSDRVGPLPRAMTLDPAPTDATLGYGTGTGLGQDPPAPALVPADPEPAPSVAPDPDPTDPDRKVYRLEGSRLVSLTRTKKPPAPPPSSRKNRRRRRGDRVIAAYDDAMDLLKAGQHQAAYDAFESIARRHPRHDYADNALYWKGEAAYDQGRFADALAAFTEVVEAYGGGNKAPDALLKIGLCYYQVGDRANAIDVLTELIAAYPRARATDIARLKLAEFQG